MGIRLLILFCFGVQTLFGSNSSYIQIENQLKFAIEDTLVFKKFVENSELVGDFKMHFHSLDTYYDLYVDTPNRELYNLGMSLRFRKRLTQYDTTYVFQLKSEKIHPAANRMEIDQADLGYYSIRIDEKWVELITVLDDIFDLGYNKNKDVQHLLDGISNWLRNKYEAPIATFQALRFLFMEIEEFHPNQLQPMLIGKSLRWRSHIFYKELKMDCLNNRLVKSELPVFFQKNPNKCWLMESSFDQSRFIPLFETKKTDFLISEFEIENKFKDDGIGSAILSDFKSELMKRIELESILKSKYHQSIDAFSASIPRN